MIRVIYIIAILALACGQTVYGQIAAIHKDVAELNPQNIDQLPELDNDVLLKRYAPRSKNAPNRFAEPRDIYVDAKKSGQLEETRSGKLVWRYGVSSPGAHTLNLGFTEFFLPPSAQLYIYNKNNSDLIGPFGYQDNDDHLQLWTPILDGDAVILELHINPVEYKDLKLVLTKVNHDFKDVRKSLGSGSCNLDVVCSASDGWGIVDNYRDIISSVGAYSYNGTDQCSGVLVNNARNDCRPYFLTAEHCNLNNSNVQSMVVYWNYENSFCRQPFSFESGQPGNGSRAQFNTGASIKADLNRSDFALVELDDPINPDFNLFFAGWSWERALPDTTICVHHPGVEEKRISFEFDPISYDPTNGDTTNILVNDWDIGTTEGGSSGSPLFNTKKQVIGQLEGGFAACGNDDSDSYGWFRRSWFGEGDSTNSLQYWLDPDGLGIESINGRFCSYTINLESTVFDVCGLNQDSIEVDFSIGGLFMGLVNYSIVQAPQGLDISFAQNSSMSNVPNTVFINNLSMLSDGSYTVIIRADDGNANVDGEIVIRYNAAEVGLPELNIPMDEAEDLSLSAPFSINELQGTSWMIQVAEDEDFNVIVFEGSSETTEIEVSGLEASTIYYWRAQSINNCGSSIWTEPYRFSTALLFCTTLYSNDGPFTLSDGSPSTVFSTIDVPYGITVEDVNIPFIRGTHSYVGDLQARIFYDGVETILFSEICDDLQDFHLGFDDQSSLSQIECPPTDQMIYQPLNKLSDYNGKFAGGSWQMTVEDLAFLDGGSFDQWAIEVCFTNSILPVLVPGDHTLYICEGEPLVFDAFLDDKGLEDVLVSLSTTNMESLISDIEISTLNEKKIFIHVDDSSVLKSGSNYLILEARDKNGNLLSSTILEVIKESRNYSDLVSSPKNGEDIKLADFQEITFNSTINGEFIVEIATDEAFKNVVYTVQGSNDNSIAYNGTLPEGNYFLRVLRGAEFCADASFTVDFSLDLNTSSVEESLNAVLSVFPNPFEHTIWIDKKDLNVQLAYRIYNAQAQSVMAGNINSNDEAQRVDVSQLTPGIYMIEIRSGNERWVERLVKM